MRHSLAFLFLCRSSWVSSIPLARVSLTSQLDVHSGSSTKSHQRHKRRNHCLLRRITAHLRGLHATHTVCVHVHVHVHVHVCLRLQNEIFDTTLSGIEVKIDSEPLIEGNHIHHTALGIYAFDHGGGIFARNRIHHNRMFGIDVRSRSNALLVENQISNESCGIHICDAEATIERNRIVDCERGGLLVSRRGHVIVNENYLSSPKSYGMFFERETHGKKIAHTCVRAEISQQLSLEIQSLITWRRVLSLRLLMRARRSKTTKSRTPNELLSCSCKARLVCLKIITCTIILAADWRFEGKALRYC
jgi:parallel beta-helix repeat protein